MALYSVLLYVKKYIFKINFISRLNYFYILYKLVFYGYGRVV